jgi:hypothetical protein
MANIDERLEALTRNLEILTLDVEAMRERGKKLDELVEKHERWKQKVERSLVAGIEAALTAWRNGDEPEGS